MARKAGQGKEEEESRARQQEEKTPVRDEEKKPACHGGAHHVVEQDCELKLESKGALARTTKIFNNNNNKKKNLQNGGHSMEPENHEASGE
ncbi:hypothetical protein STEG23_025826 [Scotinomys teguina]